MLLGLRLAGEQEAAVRRDDGDAVLPGAIAVGARGEAGADAVPQVAVGQVHLALGKRVLRVVRESDEWKGPRAPPSPKPGHGIVGHANMAWESRLAERTFS